jgi:tetratricopeptide (TPR) repeat protein
MRIFIAATLVCLLTVSPAAADWTQIQTPHYLLLGDASPGDMRRIARRFEQFHAVMERLLSRGALAFATPTVIIVFKNRSSFRPYLPLYRGKPQELAGIALSGDVINYMALDASGGEASYPVIFHELTHQITRNVSPSAALWVSEGVAEYYSTFEIYDGTEVNLGIPILDHIRMLRSGQFMPLRELLNADSSSEAYNERDRSSLFYAQSWALVNLLVKDAPSMHRFAHYMRSAQQGLSEEEALLQAYGLDLEALEQALKRHVNQVRLTAVRWTFPDRITDADMKVTTVDEAVALPHLAAIQVRVDRNPEAEQRLATALAASPRSAMAHAMLARIKLGEKRSVEAAELLVKEMTAETFLDHYMLAAALAEYIDLSGPTTAAGSRAVDALRERVAAAVAQQNDVAEAWRLASYGHLLSSDLEQAEAAIGKALALAPANERYRFALAEILTRKREFARARSILGLLMARARTPEMRQAARERMGWLVRFENSVAPDNTAKPPGDEKAARPESPDPPLTPERDPAAPAPTGTAPTPPPSPPPARSARETIPLFRTVEPGETRFFGTFTAIECDGAGVTIVVQLAAKTLRVKAPKFDSIQFITYRDTKTTRVGCGPRPAAETVYLTWKGTDSGEPELRSDTVVVELTPLGYVP